MAFGLSLGCFMPYRQGWTTGAVSDSSNTAHADADGKSRANRCSLQMQTQSSPMTPHLTGAMAWVLFLRGSSL